MRGWKRTAAAWRHKGGPAWRFWVPRRYRSVLRARAEAVKDLGQAAVLSLRRANRGGLVILDDGFPWLGTGFRIAEFNHYLRVFPDCQVYCDRSRFEEELRSYRQRHPELAERVHRHNRFMRLKFSVAYVVFLHNAYRFLPTLERCRLPFVLELYPGGHFGIDCPASDTMLSRVCSSAYLQHVIATNPVIASYIVERRFCDPDRVQMIREGVLDLPSIGEPKRRFPDHKGTFDVCFAAYKQMPFGLDKGYDIFVEVAKRLARVSGDFTFHVVGTFGPEDIDVSELGSRIHFYGPQLDDFWAHYYRDKDMILSPNRPFVLAPGAFDGIPTGSVLLAGACGVTMFCSDQLGLTRGLFQDGRDIVLIDTDVERIVERVIDYYESPAKLYETGERGASRVREICSYECGMRPRIDLLRAVANQSGT